MPARMENPLTMFPHAGESVTELLAVIDRSGLDPSTRNLVRLRVSQINKSGRDIHEASRQAREEGETRVRLLGLATWQASPFYSDAERAALALTEVVTRLEGGDPVPDAVWDEARRHYDEHLMAALLLTIAITNAGNRFNISTRQVAGA